MGTRFLLLGVMVIAALVVAACGGEEAAPTPIPLPPLPPGATRTIAPRLYTFPVGEFPVALAFDGNSIWVANLDENTLSKLALDGTELGTFPVGEGPWALTFDGQSIWVANAGIERARGGNTVSKLALDGTVLGTFPVVQGPAALAFDGQSIWVANRGDDTVTKLALDGTVLGTFTVGDRPLGLAFDGESIWVANTRSFGGDVDYTEGRVTKLALDGTDLGTFSVGDRPFPIALAFDGESIWVTNYGIPDPQTAPLLVTEKFSSGTITKLALDGTELGTFPVGYGPVALAFDGQSIWVTNNADNTVSKLTILEE